MKRDGIFAIINHMLPRSWTWQQVLLLLYFISYRNSDHIIIAEAQLISAYEQAYGKWNIKLRGNIFARRKWHRQQHHNIILSNDNGNENRDRRRRKRKASDLQLMFPDIDIMQNNMQYQRENNNNETDTDTNTNANANANVLQVQSTSNDEKQQQTRIIASSKSVNSVSCILNLERNGRFTLSLLDEEKDSREELHNNAQSSSSSFNNIMVSKNHSPLNGEWFLTPNPYCVTDRQYDTLLLVSEPRMRRIRPQQKLRQLKQRILPINNDRAKQPVLIERATIELRCKLYGRYGMGSIRNKLGIKHGRACGRMVHGTIVIVKEVLYDTINDDDDDDDVGKKQRKRLMKKKKDKSREVVGTFCGRTIVDDGYDCVGSSDRDEDTDEDDDDLDLEDHF